MIEFTRLKIMTKEAEQILKLRAQGTTYSSLAEKRASQQNQLQASIDASDSIEESLRLYEFSERINFPARLDRIAQRMSEVNAEEQRLLADAREKLARMSVIPALAAKHEEFKASIDALDQPTPIITSAPAPEASTPASLPAQNQEAKAARKFTRNKEYTTPLPDGSIYITTSSYRTEILRTLLNGSTPQEEIFSTYGSGARARVSELNRELAEKGMRILLDPELREFRLEIAPAAKVNDLPEDEGISTQPGDEVTTEPKRGYVKTGPEDLYRGREDIIVYFGGEEVLIKDAPGFPRKIIALLQAGVNTRHGLADVLYPEDKDRQVAMNKVLTNLRQGASRLLAPYGLTVINLTTTEEMRNGKPSNYQIAKLEEKLEDTPPITPESLTAESSNTMELTNYEAGVIANLFREKAVIDEITALGIPVLEPEKILEIQNYIPLLPDAKGAGKISSVQMNTIRLNILNKLQDIHDQGLDEDIFDRSGLGVNELLLYLNPLPKDQRNQVLAVIAAFITKKMIDSNEAHRYSDIIPDSQRQALIDKGIIGRPAEPGEALASKPKRAKTSPDSRGSVGLAGFVRYGDMSTIEAQRPQLRDSRHRTLYTGSQIRRAASQEPAYTDSVVAQGPKAIADARAAAIASVDLPRSQAEAIEAGELRHPKRSRRRVQREGRVEAFPRDYDALLRHNTESLSEIGKLINSVLKDIPELMSNPRGLVSPGRLTQVYNNLTTTTLNQYEELRIIQATIQGGKKWYDLINAVKARFYKEFDPMLNLSKRGRRQVDSAARSFVEKRIAEIVELASE